MDEFRKFAVESFNVLLLTIIFVGLLGFTLHMAHHDMDRELISWGRESSGTVLGGLLYALTGKNKEKEGTKQ